MAGRDRALDLEPLASRNIAGAAQRAADQLDDLGRQMRQIRQRLLLDLAVLAVGTPKQRRVVDRLPRPALRRDHVHRTRWTSMPSHDQESTAPTGHLVVTTISEREKARTPATTRDPGPYSS